MFVLIKRVCGPILYNCEPIRLIAHWNIRVTEYRGYAKRTALNAGQ